MNNKKRLLTLIVAVMMIFSMVAVLAACDSHGKSNGKGSDIDWTHYLDSISSLTNKIGNKLPSISSKTFGSNVSVSMSYANEGLLVLTFADSVDNYKYGYSIVANKEFGNSDSLTDMYAGEYNTFRGVRSNGDQVLYDITGTKIAVGTSISLSEVSVTNNGDTTTYLKIVVDGTTTYRKVLVDGSLSSMGLSELPSKQDNVFLPEVGEVFTTTPETLANWLDIDVDYWDNYLERTYVRNYGRTIVFFNSEDEEISRLTTPLDCSALIYVDKHIVYSTLTPVDPMATRGYNYVSGSDKYNAQLYSFDISSGKTSKLNVNYVLTEAGGTLYNKYDNAYDLAVVEVCMMVDGVAWEDYADVLVIDANGSNLFSYQDSLYGIPMAVVGDNYLTSGGFIVDANGELVASLGDSIKTVLSDGFVVEVDGKIGVVGFDGVVTVGFEYALASSSSIAGKYAIVIENDRLYSLNLSTNRATRLTSLTSASEENISITTLGNYSLICVREYYYGTGSYSYTYSFYNLDGTKVISHATSNYISLSTCNIDGAKYGIARVQVTDSSGDTSYVYLRFAF